MKLLTTAIFLIVPLVMMNSSFAQSDDILAAIQKQTEAIKEQTRAMKVIAAIDWGGSVTSNFQYINEVVKHNIIDQKPDWVHALEDE